MPTVWRSLKVNAGVRGALEALISQQAFGCKGFAIVSVYLHGVFANVCSNPSAIFAAAPCILMRHGPFPSGLLPTCIRWLLRALISVSDCSEKGNQMDMQIFFQILLLSKLLFARALPDRIYKLTVGRVGRVDRLGRAIQNRALPARQHFDALVSRDAAREGHVRWSHKHTHTCVHEYMYVHTYIHDIQISDYSLLSCSNCVSLPISTTNNEIKGFGHTLAFLWRYQKVSKFTSYK